MTKATRNSWNKVKNIMAVSTKKTFVCACVKKVKNLSLFRPFRTCIAGSAVFGATEFVNPTFEGDSFFDSSSVSHVKHGTVKRISK